MLGFSASKLYSLSIVVLAINSEDHEDLNALGALSVHQYASYLHVDIKDNKLSTGI
jgi:hypothetical protein